MKKENEYSRSIPFYGTTPKAVFAAIALSLAVQLTQVEFNHDAFGAAHKKLLDEWLTLHNNRIVPQFPIDGLGQRWRKP